MAVGDFSLRASRVFNSDELKPIAGFHTDVFVGGGGGGGGGSKRCLKNERDNFWTFITLNSTISLYIHT